MAPDLTAVACPSCDLLQTLTPLARTERALCARCGHCLLVGGEVDLQFNLALAVAALILIVIANGFPIMSLQLEGQARATTVIEGVQALWRGDRAETAILVAAVTIVIPLIRSLAVIGITLPLLNGDPLRRHARGLRFVADLTPWGMTEVYLLGALVAFVKLGDMARVEAGPAMFAFAALSILSAYSTRHLDGQRLWLQEQR